jgi:hypothetical protein
MRTQALKYFYWMFLLLVTPSAYSQLRFVKEVNTIAELKQLNIFDINKTCSVKGYATPYDGGQGVFVADENSVTPQDGGIVIAPNNNVGRWRRQVEGREYMARWWGPTRTNLTLQTAINWVSANGWGTVTCDGGTWTVKGDDSTRIQMRTGVTLKTAADSEIVLAASPTNNWILIDFPLDIHDWQVGPARLVGWDLLPPGGDTNKTGVILSIQDTVNGTIGGIRASNWYTQYADIGSGNVNLQMFDQDWQLGAMAFGATGDGFTDDSKNVQAYARFCERYKQEMFFRPTTNGYRLANIQITNGIAVKIRGEKTLIKSFYFNPTEGTLPHYSSAFTISANNCSIDSFKFQTVGDFPITETNTAVTGFFIPINIHIGTNTTIKNCEFDVESGKGVILSGSYTKISDCFFNRCGVTEGLGNIQDWLFDEAAVPFKGQKFSPLSTSIINCTFMNGTPYKHTVFFSSASDFLFSGNKMINMNSPNPLLIYSGDEGVTDVYGTNVYEFSGKVVDNTITGTNFGVNGAICVRLNTPTNYITDVGFVVTNMFSSVLISGNHIHGSGPASYTGIQLIVGKGTKILNNDVRVTGSPIHLVGNCNGVIIDGNDPLQSTLQGVAGTIGFSVGFLAPDSFSDVVIRNNTIITPPSDENVIRPIAPIFLRNFTFQNNRVEFHGAAGAGDAPRLLQLAGCEGFVDINLNKFYVTNSSSGRPLVYVSGTNCDLSFDLNKSYVIPGSVVTRRGLTSLTKSARVGFNDVGSMEFIGNTELDLKRNFLSSSNSYPYPLEVTGVDRYTITGNTISNFFNGDALCAVIAGTNGTFGDNIVSGNSSGPLIVSALGRMYVGNNPINNLGSGGTLVGASAPGIVTHTVYERPMHINVGASTEIPFSIQRSGSPATNWLTIDEWFTTSSRDAQYHVGPYDTNDLGGHAFFVHKTNGFEQFAFGAHGYDPPVFYIGDQTNSILTFIGGLGTNTMFYLDDNRFLQRLTLGANMTFVAGELNSLGGGGGGSTNDTPWQLDHDANQFSLTNSFKVTIRHSDTSVASMTVSNANGGSTYGIDTSGNAIINSGVSSAKVQLAGTDHLSLSVARLSPAGSTKALGTSTDRWSALYLGQSGVDIGGMNLYSGSGTPEGAVAAPVSSIYFRTNGAAGTVLYMKETGVGNTGWVAYNSHATGTIPTTIMVAASDMTTTITAGVLKAYLRMPYAMTLTSVKASLVAAQTSGSIFTVDINETGTTILSTKLTVDNSEKTSSTAATAAVISDTALANDAEITIDVDQAGVGPAGLIITLQGTR